MGYSSEFLGAISVDPPLTRDEQEFLRHFQAEVPGIEGRSHWVARFDDSIEVETGSATGWEKAYDPDKWLGYIIEHFIGDHPDLGTPFRPHKCNGEVEVRGEDPHDIWKIIVTDNQVFRAEGRVVFHEPSPVAVSPRTPILAKTGTTGLGDKLKFTAIYDSPEQAAKSAAELRHFLTEGAAARRYFTGYFAGMSAVTETGIPEDVRVEFWESFERRFPEVSVAIEVLDEELASGESWPAPSINPWPCLSGFSDDAADSLVVNGNQLSFLTDAGARRYPEEANSLNFSHFLGGVVTGRFGARDLKSSVVSEVPAAADIKKQAETPTPEDGPGAS